MTTETTLTDCIADLARPFPLDSVQVRPGAVAGDGTAAIALPYVDWRLYAERLDQVVGTANWSIQLVPWGGMIAGAIAGALLQRHASEVAAWAPFIVAALVTAASVLIPRRWSIRFAAR